MSDHQQMHIDRKYIKILIKRLNRYCFMAGTERYMKDKGLSEITPKYMAKLTKEELIEFSSYANWSFKQAQKLIIKTRLEIEDATLKKEIEVDFPHDAGYILALLRDYADCLAWIALGQDISLVRNQILEYKKQSPLREQNWASIEKSLAHFNKDSDQFALATDLTSFMHLGDIYLINSKEHSRGVVEVKTGRINDEILEALQSKDKDKLINIAVKTKKPEKTFKQILRVIRQYDRALTSLDRSDNMRTDIRTKETINIMTDNRTEASWAEDVRMTNASMAKVGDKLATGWRDYCLIFQYSEESLTNISFPFFRHRINEHYKLDIEPELQDRIPVFNVGGVLGAAGTTPRSLLFMQNFGLERQEKLLLGDHFLLVSLFPPAISYLLDQHGYDFDLENMDKRTQKYGGGFMTELFGQNKIPRITKRNTEGKASWQILPGTWSRIIFDFMAPIELVSYSESIMKTKTTDKDKDARSE